MNYLVFDTETSGSPKRRKAPVSNTRNWPRVVQLAWELADGTGEVLETGDWLIKMTDTIISPGATRVHGITMAQSLAEGKPIAEALAAFSESLDKADVLVCHNLAFDLPIMGAEYYRLYREDPLASYDSVCTMLESTAHCNLPGKYGAKWPSLKELHTTLFDEDFTGAHNAVNDVQATRRSFFELRKLGVL